MKTFHLRYNKKEKRWQLKMTGSDQVEVSAKTRMEAIIDSVFVCYNTATKRSPISLRICNKKGRIMLEYTYPRSADPKRSKG